MLFDGDARSGCAVGCANGYGLCMSFLFGKIVEILRRSDSEMRERLFSSFFLCYRKFYEMIIYLGF